MCTKHASRLKTIQASLFDVDGPPPFCRCSAHFPSLLMLFVCEADHPCFLCKVVEFVSSVLTCDRAGLSPVSLKDVRSATARSKLRSLSAVVFPLCSK